jgi:hypothetical protein
MWVQIPLQKSLNIAVILAPAKEKRGMSEFDKNYVKGLVLRLKRLEHEITDLRKRVFELEKELGRKKEEELLIS